MKFSLVDSEGREVERDRYLLSLKDMNQSDHLLELIEAGATSFKIEGRLKDIGYVKNVTAAYSQRLNEIIRRYPDKYCRSSKGECSYTFTPDLRKTFNRGYTTYFLHGRQPEIASFDTPKAIGEYVGTVKELRGDSFNVAGVTSFANGDGLCFVTSSPPESGGVPVGRGGKGKAGGGKKKNWWVSVPTVCRATASGPIVCLTVFVLVYASTATTIRSLSA